MNFNIKINYYALTAASKLIKAVQFIQTLQSIECHENELPWKVVGVTCKKQGVVSVGCVDQNTDHKSLILGFLKRPLFWNFPWTSLTVVFREKWTPLKRRPWVDVLNKTIIKNSQFCRGLMQSLNSSMFTKILQNVNLLTWEEGFGCKDVNIFHHQ